MGTQRYVSLAILSTFLIGSACTSNVTERVHGVVLDQHSKKPVSDVQVEVADASTKTDVNGRFTLREVQNDAEIVASHCGYSSAEEATPPTDDLTIELEPVETRGRIISELTGQPLAGSVTVQGAKGKTKVKNSGRFSLFGLCDGTKIKVSSPGYESETSRIEEQETLEIELLATPATTIEQQIAWQREGLYGKAWSLVHPDAHNYVTKRELIDDMKAGARSGYQTVGVTVKDVVTVEWTFPTCPLDDFGPKTYPGTAALTVVYEEATPSGGRTSTRGVAHLVQTKDGRWRWFPVAGCDSEPES